VAISKIDRKAHFKIKSSEFMMELKNKLEKLRN
jgi:hypothetical protein